MAITGASVGVYANRCFGLQAEPSSSKSRQVHRHGADVSNEDKEHAKYVCRCTTHVDTLQVVACPSASSCSPLLATVIELPLISAGMCVVVRSRSLQSLGALFKKAAWMMEKQVYGQAHRHL